MLALREAQRTAAHRCGEPRGEPGTGVKKQRPYGNLPEYFAHVHCGSTRTGIFESGVPAASAVSFRRVFHNSTGTTTTAVIWYLEN